MIRKDNRRVYSNMKGWFVVDKSTNYVYKNASCCAKDLGVSRSNICDYFHGRSKSVIGRQFDAIPNEKFKDWYKFDDNGVCKDWFSDWFCN